ncbi:P-loop containing nucleoside triphosphate hydrolase domain-containing protein [Rozella allomycis CSF55]|uniref:p-loop containing nucleoside triphosphate hydrolase domain-containing protein n=1 Tax=Rozella allomycis (strain CSF55) TaxID=988480 RepID=A0A075B2A5_ROZAC|nr:P-loop containing nucleoside triphosphate hydrolase domain-containing protein [Rozella allomycis CSF55]|eukprot:EPZ34953.1 P-loop containing nucleoside triphosphate hydrolase domain-containing protein [Rozella allomycis CSF55]
MNFKWSTPPQSHGSSTWQRFMLQNNNIGAKPSKWLHSLGRPKSIKDVQSQDQVISMLKNTVEDYAQLPHLLFYGPAGTGKTSTILALCRDLFGTPELFKARVLELNASDERGIQVVREKIKNFARLAVSKTASSAPPFKIVILDEADSLTQDAQTALRRTMETYSKVTRFCLCCNYVSRIIEPLASRCAKFRFKPLDFGSTKSRLKFICENENVDITDGALTKLIDIAEGDLRRSITLMQTCANVSKTVDEELVTELSGVIPSEVIASFFEILRNDDSSFQDLCDFVKNEIILNGYSVIQIILQISNDLVSSHFISDVQKALISGVIGQSEYSLTTGADEHLQILSISSYFWRYFRDDVDKSVSIYN